MSGRVFLTRRLCRFLLLSTVALFFLTVIFAYVGNWRPSYQLPFEVPKAVAQWYNPGSAQDDLLPPGPHPIDDLIKTGNEDFEKLIKKESKTVAAAAAAYRERRGRHPPPWFDQWVKYALKKKAVLIEDLFDQIYHDLEPFWALDPEEIRNSINGIEYVLTIRNGTLIPKQDHRYRMLLWHQMLMRLQKRLPDVELAFSIMDEPRLLVPWEQINQYVNISKTRGRLEHHPKSSSEGTESPSITKYSTHEPFNFNATDQHEYINGGNYWYLARGTCHPTSGAREAEPVSEADLAAPPEFLTEFPNGSYHGYVSNWTVSKDPCTNNHLRTLHGTFIEPISIKTTHKLLPLLSGSKLPMNNDILIPAARYWTDEEKFSGIVPDTGWWSRIKKKLTTRDWKQKYDKAIWRGVASGGRNKEENWRHFQRHRFISMMNSTQVQHAIDGDKDSPFNFPLPQWGPDYHLNVSFEGTESENDLGSLSWWVSQMSDGAFTGLECYPTTKIKVQNKETKEWHEKIDPHCPYTNEYYKVVSNMPMAEQYNYKYLPDIDGNSFSGRYRAFLMSDSLPIKATVYNEWHDSRLIAWKHFVPMDNTFVDWWGIMQYFLGTNGTRGHDAEAERIAKEGSEWSNKVLRKDDMLIYMYRLILEYARVTDVNRENMAFVDDLA